MSVQFPLRADGQLDLQQAVPRFKSVAGAGDAPLPQGTAVLSSDKVFSPLMIMKQSALENNLRQLAAFCRENGVMLAAHGKTSMSPGVLRRAISEGGAWGLGAATPAQVRALRQFGIRNVFLANELVDPAGIRWIGQWQKDHPDHGFLCYVDSLQGVKLLEQNLGDSQISVLLEMSVSGGRTGCRSQEEAVSIAEAIAASSQLQLVGVAGYEGALGAGRDAAGIARVKAYCEMMIATAALLADKQLFASDNIILSAGGGAWFDVVTSCFTAASLPLPVTPLIRSGAYMAHDSGLYSRIAPFAQPGATHHFEASLEIWGRVLSRPEPGLAFVDFGRRDVPFDQDLPNPLWIRNADGSEPRSASHLTISDVNDQHAYLLLPEDETLQPGDWVGCGISHPCTAFDKWRYLPLVDDNYCVTDSLETAF
ncbi:MAG: alanine racemase [Ewingella americana]|jgi:D-serine deaminase-like pyridoxal phosphate-dependent protein|uniref:alanine racemase n=1 Tax=Ewingella americana TaxID=41202 RepID=UPI00242C8086|nr:alanine racemase [Ewingella americana]MCI1679017.1 alanine racemase [Ewingella americana]MCI1852339.1 alanine racemase [Ewingella americana]MCI1862741.1 alanine racemase [Ewingella americana]MCI2141789.1 alanine racemase [Ewingella americana]MCI2165001.1 alanine racemase [Ewingella americana]